ncbi:hypothetical protein BLA39750_01222 [Burkholderia lata]|uniref:Uncharacterized protein n=1 Tax=Burkholderia lata (strain ATCC 17760 / DSM 23089 / LMG 22485 / NCIMB 9086 / R18194 / 383) TaxID=482957 RepID=A0A6P2UVA4_BURL3|nr:hypothetical protein BLA39750_01222 [Burkholderia lata]
MSHQNDGPATPVNRLEAANSLLREARERITDKPWDDQTLLHARISEFLGLPVEYPDQVVQARDSQGSDSDD